MIAILAVAGLMVAYGLFGAARERLRRATECRLEQSAQTNFERMQWTRQPTVPIPTGWMAVETAQERAARLAWHADCNDYITEINSRFDRLVAGMPRDGSAPFDPAYWPTVGECATAPVVDLTVIAEFEPRVALDLVAEANALPPVFSWTTGALPLVEQPVCVPTAIRPPRRRRTVHAAHAATLSPLPIH